MARQIAATIEPELSKVEQQLATRKAPESLDAWDCYQRGLWNLWRFTTPGFDLAENYFQRAIAADPNFARGHGALSYVNIQRAFIDEPKDRAAGWKRHCARGAMRWRSTNSIVFATARSDAFCA